MQICVLFDVPSLISLVLQSRFPDGILHVAWLTGFPYNWSSLCNRFTVEWLQLWCNSILSHSSSQVQRSDDYQFSQQSSRDFMRVPCGSDKYGLNNVLYTHPTAIDDLCFLKTFSQSKVERSVFLILQSSICLSSQSYGMGCARATCSRNIARK